MCTKQSVFIPLPNVLSDEGNVCDGHTHVLQPHKFPTKQKPPFLPEAVFPNVVHHFPHSHYFLFFLAEISEIVCF